jgi:1,4-dihydroxy-2-naphthoyl-CoA hydrolase
MPPQPSSEPAASAASTASGDFPTTVPGFDKLLGTEYLEVGPDRVRAKLEIRSDLHQPYGIVHGGVLCSIVESCASMGAGMWFSGRGGVVGVSNHTNFLRASRSGTLSIEATPIHRGRTQQLWLVEISNEEGKAVARGEVRLANITDQAQIGG